MVYEHVEMRYLNLSDRHACFLLLASMYSSMLSKTEGKPTRPDAMTMIPLHDITFLGCSDRVLSL